MISRFVVLSFRWLTVAMVALNSDPSYNQVLTHLANTAFLDQTPSIP